MNTIYKLVFNGLVIAQATSLTAIREEKARIAATQSGDLSIKKVTWEWVD